MEAVAGAHTPDQAEALDALLVPDPTTGVTPIAWLRDVADSPSARNRSGQLSRLAHVRRNPLYMGRAVDHLRATGEPAPDHLLAHTAPLGWSHTSLTGDYVWRELAAGADDFLALRLNGRLSVVA